MQANIELFSIRMKRIIDRFDTYMKYKGLNDNQVTVSLDISVGLIGKSRSEGHDLGKKTIEKILIFYTDINRVWLLAGDGEMIKKESEYSKIVKEPTFNPQFENRSIEALSRALDRLTQMYEKVVLENYDLKDEIENLKKVASAQKAGA